MVQLCLTMAIAIGDAYGVGFEFAAPDDRRINDGITYYPHPNPKWGTGKAGSWSDDTHMTLGVMDTLRSNPHIHTLLNPVLYAEQFVKWFKDPTYGNEILGYSKRMKKHLSKSDTGLDLMELCLKNETDTYKPSCGAVMRALPCGMFSNDPHLIMAIAAAQAMATHAHVDAIRGAQAIALLTWLVRTSQPIELLEKYLSDERWITPYNGKVGNDALHVVRAVFTLHKRCKSLTEVLIAAVEQGGDTDSVAALTMGLGFLSGKKNDLHLNLYLGLYNRHMLEKEDQRFAFHISMNK
jgi:ADP-ribosylglycohydrolase